MSAARKPRRREVETDALCTKSGPYDDLYEQYGALTIEYVNDKPTVVHFDPWNDRIESAELDVQQFLQTTKQTRVLCEEGHWWKFETVEDDE